MSQRSLPSRPCRARASALVSVLPVLALSVLTSPAHASPRRDGETVTAKPSAAPKAKAKKQVEYLTEWPKPADKDTLLVDIERLCKARTEDMGKLANDALAACGASAVPFLLDRYGREKDEAAHARLHDLLVELIKADQTRLLAKSFESKYVHERTMALWRAGLSSRLERWHFGPFLTPLAGVFVLALGEQTQFFTFALAASGMPWFAAAGATLGALVVATAAALLGEARWTSLPLRWLRLGAAAIFLVGGAIIALDALRLLD